MQKNENVFLQLCRNKKNAPPYVQTREFVFIALLWLLANIGATVYMGLSRNIYFWDSATYWNLSRGIASGEIQHGLQDIYNSVTREDYNYIAALPGAVWAWIFGDSRMAYVLGLVNMYLMPTVTIVYIFTRKFSKNSGLSVVMLLLMFPALIFITFIGFADVGGLLPCFLCIYLYFSHGNRNRESLRFITIGLLLVFVILWRRWYAFFSVSFLVAMVADTVIFRKKPYGAIIAALTSGAVLILFFRDFVFTKLLVDYGDLYSGYKFSIKVDLKLMARYFGILMFLALLSGSVAAGIAKKEKRTIFLWVQMVVCFIMFVSTQTHGQQHLLLYMPSLITLAALLLKYVDKPLILGLAMFLGVLNTANVYILRNQPNNIQEIRHYALIPDFSMRAVHRADVDDIIQLKNSLDSLTENGDTVGILSSSFALNGDILKNAEASIGLKSSRTNYITEMPQVDSRDKDMTPLYKVNYMLVAYPAQTHLAPESQRVITEAVKSFDVYADIATAYEEMEQFSSSLGDIELKLYKRVSDVSDSDKAEFEKRLAN